jgi:hypothetical protein
MYQTRSTRQLRKPVTSNGSERRSGEVVGALLDAVVERLDVLAAEEPKDSVVQLSRALARNDLDERCLLGDRLVDDRACR